MVEILRGSEVRKKPQTIAPVQIMPGSLLRREREAFPSYVSYDLTLSTADFAFFAFPIPFPAPFPSMFFHFRFSAATFMGNFEY